MQQHECNKHNYLCISDTLEFYFLVKIRVLHLCKVYNYHGSQACSYKWSGILCRLDGLGMEWIWIWFMV
jgi:hypothetical protein